MDKTNSNTAIDSTALVERRRETPALPSVIPNNLNSILVLAEQYATCGYYADVRKVAQAAVKILYGQELGISPGNAMTGIYVIPTANGNAVMIGGQIMAGKIKASDRYDYDILEASADVVEVVFWRCKNKRSPDHDLEHKGCKPEGKIRVTLEEMKKSGVALAKDGKSLKKNWRDSETMLFWRAISKGTKRWFPDLLNGAAVVTEADADDMITVRARVVKSEPNDSAPATNAGSQRDTLDSEGSDEIVVTDESDGSDVSVDPRTGEVTGTKPAAASADKPAPGSGKSIFQQRAAAPEAPPAPAKEVAGTATTVRTERLYDTTTETPAPPPNPTPPPAPKAEQSHAPAAPLPAPAPEPTTSPDMEAAARIASKCPADIVAILAAAKPEDDVPNELWQKIHKAWLVDVAPGKSAAEKNQWAMGQWTAIGIVKGGRGPKYRDISHLVRNVGVFFAVKK